MAYRQQISVNVVAKTEYIHMLIGSDFRLASNFFLRKSDSLSSYFLSPHDSFK